MSKVVVDVYLNPFKDTTGPVDGSILFSYILDPNATDQTVLVTRDGIIYIRKKQNAKDMTLQFVLQTKTLEWNGSQYMVTFAPDNSQADGAREMLKISPHLGASPKDVLSSPNGEFDDVKVPTSPTPIGNDALEVQIHRGNFKQTDYQYSLAVNVYKKSSTDLVNTVQDDPQIRDRGIPSATQLILYLVAVAGFMVGATIALLAIYWP